MRIIIVAGLVLVYTLAYSQGDFPLQKGNIWQYQSTDVINPLPALEAKVVGDTVLRNGKRYSIVTGWVFGAHFMRQELSKVYAYDPIDSAEYVLFDFAAHPGDTLSKHARGNLTIIMTHTFTDTTHHVTYISFSEEAGPLPGGYSLYGWTIRDSIGVVSVTMEPGVSWNLSGALINGREYGTLTEVSVGYLATVPGPPLLYQNFPNPFNPVTTIRFLLSTESAVRLEVFNTLGQRVAVLVESNLRIGEHTISWDAAQLPSGMYVYRLQAGDNCLTRRMVLLRRDAP